MRLLLVGLFLLSSSLYAAEPSAAQIKKEQQALFFGKDDRVAIPAPYAAPYAAIGQLEVKSGGTCTATLIAPDLAVTAAHCFLMLPRKVDAGVWFKAGFHKGEYQARYQVTGQVFLPKFRKGLKYKGEDVYIQPSAAPYDIAVLQLKFKDGHAPEPMHLFAGTEQELTQALHETKSLANQAGFAEDHDTILTAHNGCTISKLRTNRTIFHRCDTLSGDSGSPIWLDLPTGPTLIAVQSSAPDWFNRHLADNVGVTVLQLPQLPPKPNK
ncbi:trypsin-like serine protease [Chitinibacter bivalviorum]|uniref:Trypsin-like serine protease n=1 Tax=Chitinibacter bivalviorum TaxID=2739434 RepID=A0A7H9BMQ0_9NEIS|nr:trypsin-like serine protease [Chitinibacter bivalviorum]QLG89498.1 trypsin-like serine protease [Chitinibacter bivalviorum]